MTKTKTNKRSDMKISNKKVHNRTVRLENVKDQLVLIPMLNEFKKGQSHVIQTILQLNQMIKNSSLIDFLEKSFLNNSKRLFFNYLEHSFIF